jgi:CheY-like chemotaxis protein
VIQEHGGLISIGAKEEGERGAVFIIQIPLSAESAASPGAQAPASSPELPIAAAAAPKAVKSKVPGQPISVLVVEDEKAVSQFLDIVLGGKDYKLRHAVDGEEALKILEKEKFDLIICDHGLPKVSGWHLYEEIRALDPDIAKRFLFISGTVKFNAKLADLFQTNKVPYLPKPFTAEQILTVLEDMRRAA